MQKKQRSQRFPNILVAHLTFTRHNTMVVNLDTRVHAQDLLLLTRRSSWHRRYLCHNGLWFAVIMPQRPRPRTDCTDNAMNSTHFQKASRFACSSAQADSSLGARNARSFCKRSTASHTRSNSSRFQSASHGSAIERKGCRKRTLSSRSRCGPP